VRIVMRCTHFMPELCEELTTDREHICLLEHENGIRVDESTAKVFSHKLEHDPTEINRARILAEDPRFTYLGLFYQDKEAPRYDLYGASNLGFPVDRKIDAINKELDKFAI
jgi:2-oxoglutarate/2-oxoacid ferredoxin oxidoreductase subunit beta